MDIKDKIDMMTRIYLEGTDGEFIQIDSERNIYDMAGNFITTLTLD